MLEMTQNPSSRRRSDGLQPSDISDHTRGSELQMEIPVVSQQYFIVTGFFEQSPGLNVRTLETQQGSQRCCSFVSFCWELPKYGFAHTRRNKTPVLSRRMVTGRWEEINLLVQRNSDSLFQTWWLLTPEFPAGPT